MAHPVDTLILDFGGVISRTMFETHAASEAALGLAAGTLTWLGPFAPDTGPDVDPLWQSMQAGEISERDYWQTRSSEVGKLVGENWTAMSDLVKAARGNAPLEIIRPETLSTINAAKASGCTLAILSNELDLFYGKDFRQKLPFLQDFDLVVDATYTKILKPAPEAYLDCLDQLGKRADQCVFVDDQARNVSGGEAIGLHCVKFDVRQPGQSCAETLKILNLDPSLATSTETSHA
jgi:putative hydrolase of the HAD superfamily